MALGVGFCPLDTHYFCWKASSFELVFFLGGKCKGWGEKIRSGSCKNSGGQLCFVSYDSSKIISRKLFRFLSDECDC